MGAVTGGGDVDAGWAMAAEGMTLRRVATNIGVGVRGVGVISGILLAERIDERTVDTLIGVGWAKARVLASSSSLRCVRILGGAGRGSWK